MQRRLSFLALSVTLALLVDSPVLAAANAKLAVTPAVPASAPTSKKPAAIKLVDINRASRAELKTLPGIGDAEADRIIAARPYPSKAKLAADKVLSYEAYTALKGRIVAVQNEPPQQKAAGKASGKP